MSQSEQLAMLFDMDGVLIDSYQAHFESWQVVTAEYGRTYSEEEFVAGFGRTSRELIREQWEGAEDWSEEQVAELDDKKEVAFREILARDFPAMPGAQDLMRELRDAGFRIAVASSGPRENVDFVIEKLGIRDFLTTVITGNDVTKGKPHPQVFQMAAAGVEVNPQNCCVVEDAPAGVAAAKGAETACIGLVQTGKYGVKLDKADLVVSSLTEISVDLVTNLIQQVKSRTK